MLTSIHPRLLTSIHPSVQHLRLQLLDPGTRRLLRHTDWLLKRCGWLSTGHCCQRVHDESHALTRHSSRSRGKNDVDNTRSSQQRLLAHSAPSTDADGSCSQHHPSNADPPFGALGNRRIHSIGPGTQPAGSQNTGCRRNHHARKNCAPVVITQRTVEKLRPKFVRADVIAWSAVRGIHRTHSTVPNQRAPCPTGA